MYKYSFNRKSFGFRRIFWLGTHRKISFFIKIRALFMRKYMLKYSKILSIWKNKRIRSTCILKTISLYLEKCFETVTTWLLFSKLLLILLFSHKILIFFKKNLGVQTYYWTPSFILGGGSMDPLEPPVADPMGIYTSIHQPWFKV